MQVQPSQAAEFRGGADVDGDVGDEIDARGKGGQRRVTQQQGLDVISRARGDEALDDEPSFGDEITASM